MENKTMTVNGKEYEIIKLLGKGKGGYSYLATDGERNYVLKQIHHEPCEYYQFGNKIEAEINDYKRLKNIGIRIPEMIDVDIEKERVLKDYIEGDTIYDIVLKDEMKDEYLEQMREMCKLLYPANTNIDYFPTNFVVQDGIMYYIDFECNNYMEEWNFENWGIKYWSKTDEFMKIVKKKEYDKENLSPVLKFERYVSFYKSIIDQDRSAIVICNLNHEIIYMNPAAVRNYIKRGGDKLIGQSLLKCHNSDSAEKIKRVVEWFARSVEHNIVYTFHNEKQNKDVYMVALREEGKLIGYYEKHEYRNQETMEQYDLWE